MEHYRAIVEQVIRVMRERPAVPLTLREMAGLSFMSPFHFNRVFSLVTGIPPGLFQSALRFEAAKKLVLTTPMNLAEICEELGFLSLGTFARQFKAKVGVTPERLRRLATTIQESPLAAGGHLPVLPELPHPSSASLAGEVAASEGFGGLIAVVLFRKAIPEGWPVACALRIGGGPFVLPRVAEGNYYLLAAGLDGRDGLVACLTDGRQILRSGAPGQRVRITRKKLLELPDPSLRLRPADPVDPPILFAFPALILEPLLGAGSGKLEESPGALFQLTG